MATIVRGFYGAEVAVVNMGDVFSMGPEEAAFVVNELIKPRTAIPSHANNNAAAKVATFSAAVDKRIDVIVPLSGITITCDGKGNCTQPELLHTLLPQKAPGPLPGAFFYWEKVSGTFFTFHFSRSNGLSSDWGPLGS